MARQIKVASFVRHPCRNRDACGGRGASTRTRSSDEARARRRCRLCPYLSRGDADGLNRAEEPARCKLSRRRSKDANWSIGSKGAVDGARMALREWELINGDVEVLRRAARRSTSARSQCGAVAPGTGFRSTFPPRRNRQRLTVKQVHVSPVHASPTRCIDRADPQGCPVSSANSRELSSGFSPTLVSAAPLAAGASLQRSFSESRRFYPGPFDDAASVWSMMVSNGPSAPHIRMTCCSLETARRSARTTTARTRVSQSPGRPSSGRDEETSNVSPSSVLSTWAPDFVVTKLHRPGRSTSCVLRNPPGHSAST